MRLIDDTATKICVWELFNSIYNDASRFTEEETKFAKQILSKVQEQIDNQPTAYDVDNVVEQLRKNSFPFVDDPNDRNVDIDKAIKIVKAEKKE